jgi:hypothetical protein
MGFIPQYIPQLVSAPCCPYPCLVRDIGANERPVDGPFRTLGCFSPPPPPFKADYVRVLCCDWRGRLGSTSSGTEADRASKAAEVGKSQPRE